MKKSARFLYLIILFSFLSFSFYSSLAVFGFFPLSIFNLKIFIYYLILILTLGSVIGMIIHRNLFIKFFLCFESFFFIISVIILIWSSSLNVIIIILYLIWNSTFEVVLGLTISLLQLFLLFSFAKLFHYFLLVFFIFWFPYNS